MVLHQIKIGIEGQLQFQGRYIKHRCIVLCNDALSLNTITKLQRGKITRLRDVVEELPDPYGWYDSPSEKDLKEIVRCLNQLRCVLDLPS